LTFRRSFKYRLYPNASQVAALTYQLREACDLYNCALEERKSAWKTCRKSISCFDQIAQLKFLRAEKLVGISNAKCAERVLRRLDKTFKAFFARVKSRKHGGFPRFKSSRNWNVLDFVHGDGSKIDGRLLYIQGIGKIKIKLHRPIDGKIKTASIKREAGRWFAIFSVECDPAPLPESTESAGIDMGLTAFATLDDGTEIDNPRFHREADRKLRVAQRRLSRRKDKKSNRKCKAVQTLQRQYAHVKNQRADFHHKLSRMLVNRYGLIAVEDLNIKGFAKSRLAKSIQDAGWGSFLNKLAYKAESAGREFVKVNPRGTSQTCLCGARVPKGLGDRWHSCPACGLEGARDHVSAQLILRLGLSLRSATWPDAGACVLREAVSV